MLKVLRTNVVLPTHVLEKECQPNYREIVQVYLKRYKDYQLIDVANGFAICEVAEGRDTSDNKNKKGSH